MATYTEAEKKLRTRYTKIRKGIMQQTRRLAKAFPGSIRLEQYRGEFPSLREIGDISLGGLQRLTRRAQGVYSSKVMTIAGYRQSLLKSADTLRTLNGFDFVNYDNVEAVWKFVEEMRTKGLADIYGYNYFIGMYNRIAKSGLSPKQTEEMVKEWTEYGERYQQRVLKAHERGKEAPKPKRLTVPRKRRSGNE